MKGFLRDAGLVLGVLATMALLYAAANKPIPYPAFIVGASVGLAFAAAKARRSVLEKRARAERFEKRR